MSATRRNFLMSAAALGTITLLPFRAGAAGMAAHSFKGSGGEIAIHPVSHASFVMTTPMGTIYSDPVGGADLYAGLPKPDLITVTHRHGDHYNADTLKAFGDTPILTNADVHGMMDEGLKGRSSVIAPGGGMDWKGARIDAIPAYNLAADRQNFHPKARGDNGYVLSLAGLRVYISGDTEDIPEMRALKDIDVAFICMNLPFTMTADAAASAVAEFKPKYVYPYHYRGRDGGTQDPKAFAKMVGDAAEVKLVDWYPKDDSL